MIKPLILKAIAYFYRPLTASPTQEPIPRSNPLIGENWRHCNGSTYQIIEIRQATLDQLSDRVCWDGNTQFYSCSPIEWGDTVVFYQEKDKALYGRSLSNFMGEIEPGKFRFERVEK
jgi:hypothetical protein